MPRKIKNKARRGAARVKLIDQLVQSHALELCIQEKRDHSMLTMLNSELEY